ENFIPNPHGAPGTRFYRTGDLVRCLPNGQLVFLGRTDHQVKVRGFRIEVGEIEVTLAEHPAIRDCAVVAQGDPTGNTQLAAFIVTTGSMTPSVDELRRFLKQRLPDFMVPGVVQCLEALPLTPGGKVDRQALRELRCKPVSSVDYVAPR